MVLLSHLRNLRVASSAILFLGCVTVLNATPLVNESRVSPTQSPDTSESTREQQIENHSLGFLPDVHASVEAAGVSGGDYTFETERQVAFDLLKLQNWFLHFGITETSLFDPSPSQIDHEFQYLGIGRETDSGDRIKLFWDHTCHNPSRQLPEDEHNAIHWNELGIGYETNGMRLGHENDGIAFDSEAEWLHAINWTAALGKIFQRSENDYDYILKLGIRDDIFRYGRHVFFTQFDLDSTYDDRGVNFNPRLEIGDRILLTKKTCLIPFLSYQHFHDWYDLGDGEEFFFAGIRLQASLDSGPETNNISSLEGGLEKAELESSKKEPLEQELDRKTYFTWDSGFHVAGGYAKLFDNEDYGCSSDVAIDLDLLQSYKKTLTLNTYTGVLTLPGDLNPYIVQYKIGAALKIDWDDYVPDSDLRMFYSYSCLYGVEHEDMMRDYNLIGTELKNDGSHWNWSLQAGLYPFTDDFDYWGELLASVNYDFRGEGITPYVGCAGHYLQGDHSELGHAVETGLKIPGQRGVFEIYFRWQDDFDVFRFGKGEQALLGFRFGFS